MWNPFPFSFCRLDWGQGLLVEHSTKTRFRFVLIGHKMRKQSRRLAAPTESKFRSHLCQRGVGTNKTGIDQKFPPYSPTETLAHLRNQPIPYAPMPPNPKTAQSGPAPRRVCVPVLLHVFRVCHLHLAVTGSNPWKCLSAWVGRTWSPPDSAKHGA